VAYVIFWAQVVLEILGVAALVGKPEGGFLLIHQELAELSVPLADETRSRRGPFIRNSQAARKAATLTILNELVAPNKPKD
jgi:hypothetical protein